MDEIWEKIARKSRAIWFSTDYPSTWKEVAKAILSIPIVKPGGECPECRGTKFVLHGSYVSDIPCPNCNSEGSITDQTLAIQEIIEEWLSRLN